MARRAPYTKVEKEGQERPSHVHGMGDVVFRGFQCLNGGCQEYVVVREDEIGPDPDAFIDEWIPYPEEIRRVRNMILEYAEADILEGASHVPTYLLEPDEPPE